MEKGPKQLKGVPNETVKSPAVNSNKPRPQANNCGLCLCRIKHVH